MISHTELKKGVLIIVDGAPYQVIEATPQRYAQRELMIQTRMKNIVTGAVLEKTVHQGEAFEEAEITKLRAKFLYMHRDRFFFSEEQNPSRRFELTKEQIGDNEKFMKLNVILDALIFKEKIISISLPIKIHLKVTDAPPGIKGDSAQGATKAVTLESGAEINTPLFIETGDIVEVNTETGEI